MGGLIALPRNAVAAPALASTGLPPTPMEMMGPFYPLRRLAEDDADLAHLAGHSKAAKGQLIEVYGRVVRPDGSPVAGATVSLWQANAAGRYMHPSDRNPAPLDPDFQGFGQLRTGRGGDYRFVSVKPGQYPTPQGLVRTPHLHFEVTGAQYRLVTQMYFPGEPLNDSDFLRSTLSARQFDPATVTAARADSHVDGALGYRWDIVLLEPA
jgi:protocatechuate 3,4-dioxygenase beta subunit